MLCVVLILTEHTTKKSHSSSYTHTNIAPARDMALGYDKVFEFAPQFGLYQLYLFVCAYVAAGSIYGPFLTASVFFQVLYSHRLLYRLLYFYLVLQWCSSNLKLSIKFNQINLIPSLQNQYATSNPFNLTFPLQYEPQHRCRSDVLEKSNADYNNSFIMNNIAVGSCHMVREFIIMMTQVET